MSPTEGSNKANPTSANQQTRYPTPSATGSSETSRRDSRTSSLESSKSGSVSSNDSSNVNENGKRERSSSNSGEDSPTDNFLKIVRKQSTPGGTTIYATHKRPTDLPEGDDALVEVPRMNTQARHMDSNDLLDMLQNQVLIGTLVAPCHILFDVNGERGMFFVFHDLSVRSSGTYRLKFSLFDVNHQGTSLAKATIISDSFTVYSPKAFLGMQESTDLTKCFARQGVRIHIRNERTVDAGTSGTVMDSSSQLELAGEKIEDDCN